MDATLEDVPPRLRPTLRMLLTKCIDDERFHRFTFGSLEIDSVYSSHRPDETVLNEASKPSHPHTLGRHSLPSSGDLVAYYPGPTKRSLCVADCKRGFRDRRPGEVQAKQPEVTGLGSKRVAMLRHSPTEPV